MYACDNSKPQGLEEHLRLERLEYIFLNDFQTTGTRT